VNVTQPELSAPAAAESVVRVDALETFVELLAQVEGQEGSADGFYSSLCEAVCRLTSMDRAVIFRYDDARRRVRAAGAFHFPLDRFRDAHVTVESAPIARQALVEDRVIAVDAEAVAAEVPESFRDLLVDSLLVCVPLSAGGRWSGVILADRRPRRPLAEEERNLLWTLGKTAALAEAARHATYQGVRARQLQERIDLAREVHEGVIQRLFAVLLVVSGDVPLSAEARERATVELQAGLRDLRRALQRPLGRAARATDTTLKEEIARLRSQHPDLGIRFVPGSESVSVPRELEPLAQSVLAEAIRNAHKHASPTRVDVALSAADGAWVMEVCNDGVRGPAPTVSGMGLRLAALEALQVGGLMEFGLREPGVWRVRLAVPQ
jgi:signal transduction histidine kinase